MFFNEPAEEKYYADIVMDFLNKLISKPNTNVYLKNGDGTMIELKPECEIVLEHKINK